MYIRDKWTTEARDNSSWKIRKKSVRYLKSKSEVHKV